MKQKLIDNIMQGTLRFLNNSQAAQLQKVLEWEFAQIEVLEREKAPQEIKNENNELVEMFFSAKRVEGCSEKSLKYYRATIDNIRRILSSFFSWLEDEEYILKSPVRRIHKVKAASTVKETYSDEALETMRDNCENLRDLALVDMLASTGMPAGSRLSRERSLAA